MFMKTLLEFVPQEDSKQDEVLGRKSRMRRQKSSEYDISVDHVIVDDGSWDIPSPVTESDLPLLLQRLSSGERMRRRSVRKLLQSRVNFLKQVPNLQDIHIGENDSITVVGDLHGQLDDLLLILQQNGNPSPSNKYVFNGDFVDRGNMGVEVCIVILAFQEVYPEHVFLNRGNHEEEHINCVYGFQRECQSKYDAGLFQHFQDLFSWLPLCASINGKLFVCHGGIPYRDSVTVEDINKIPRASYSTEDDEYYRMLHEPKPQHPQQVMTAHPNQHAMPTIFPRPVMRCSCRFTTHANHILVNLTLESSLPSPSQVSLADINAQMPPSLDASLSMEGHHLMRDLLWSDPIRAPGNLISARYY
jgi:hypothetical protein